jgi:hypothetical protein
MLKRSEAKTRYAKLHPLGGYAFAQQLGFLRHVAECNVASFTFALCKSEGCFAQQLGFLRHVAECNVASFTFALCKSEGCFAQQLGFLRNPTSKGPLGETLPQAYFLQKAKSKLGDKPQPSLASTHINGGVMVKTRYAKQSCVSLLLQDEARSLGF